MPLFMVERNVKGAAPQAMAATHAALVAGALEWTARGRAIHLVRTVLVPGEGRCIQVFDCSDPATVWRLLEEIGVPADGAMEIHDVKPPTAAEPVPATRLH